MPLHGLLTLNMYVRLSAFNKILALNPLTWIQELTSSSFRLALLFQSPMTVLPQPLCQAGAHWHSPCWHPFLIVSQTGSVPLAFNRAITFIHCVFSPWWEVTLKRQPSLPLAIESHEQENVSGCVISPLPCDGGLCTVMCLLLCWCCVNSASQQPSPNSNCLSSKCWAVQLGCRKTFLE